MNSGTGIYKSGVLAFFCRSYPDWCAFRCCYCFIGSDELSMLSVFSNSFVDVEVVR